MEDRHSFSDPRPVKGCELPTWQVDVFREGVDEPVLTLLIDKTTLPPRMRKKRVVWKLPDSTDEVPNFGSDERKRMLELFKTEKKTRKKLLKRNSSIQGSDGESPQKESRQAQMESDGVQEEESPQKESQEVQQEENDCEQTITPQEEDTFAEQQMITTLPQQRHAAVDVPQTNGHARPPGLSLDNEIHNNLITEPQDTNTHDFQPEPGPPIPPPGFDNLSLNRDEPPPRSMTTTPTNGRFFTVPPLSTNIPVDLAKIVVDTYYQCITHGHSEELLLHYTVDAQKSLSVGGAHAVCSVREECLLQLESLHGSQFLVRGVVAQPGIGESVVLLITGSVQNATTLQLLPFCHSVTLVCTNAQSFQIHNDAMALLTD